MYMANAKILHLVPNATYIPLTSVGGFAIGDMLVSFALGNAKVWRWGSKPTPVPNANGFASQRNIGFKVKVMLTEQ